MTTPPSTCCSAPMALMTRPTSCTATYLVTLTVPMSVSTSTSAACAANAVRSQRPSLRWTPRPMIVVPVLLTTLEMDIWNNGSVVLLTNLPSMVKSAGFTAGSGLLAFLASAAALAAAAANNCRRTSSAASYTPQPPEFVWRLPPDPPVSVVRSVSMYGVMVTDSHG